MPRFHQAMLRGLVLNFRAIDDSVSPDLTTYEVNVGPGVGVGRTNDGLGEITGLGVGVGTTGVPDEHAFDAYGVPHDGSGVLVGLGAAPVATMMSAIRASTTRTMTPAPIGVASGLAPRGRGWCGRGSYGSVMSAV